MGRSSFWFAHGYKGSNRIPGNSKGSGEIYGNTQTNKRNKASFLEIRIKSLLEKYENDKDTRDNILGELQIYRLNLTLAREFHDKTAERNLTKKFIHFLNQF